MFRACAPKNNGFHSTCKRCPTSACFFHDCRHCRTRLIFYDVLCELSLDGLLTFEIDGKIKNGANDMAATTQSCTMFSHFSDKDGIPDQDSCTAWCSETGSLMSLDACNSGASSDRREPISLHQAVSDEKKKKKKKKKQRSPSYPFFCRRKCMRSEIIPTRASCRHNYPLLDRCWRIFGAEYLFVFCILYLFYTLTMALNTSKRGFIAKECHMVMDWGMIKAGFDDYRKG